ncbi:MAG: methyltransferase domain-containing protein [Acidobacteriota bacterium]|nr:methyltransferase domain-containing protein [Acidobacteriota bacterium]
MTTTLSHPDADVIVEELPNGMKEVSVRPRKGLFVPVDRCQTDYPLSLIQLILDIKGADYVCDEICRDADPGYVQRDLEHDLTAYFAESDFAGKRVLDFGCGSGASSMILARAFPAAEIVGVELEPQLLTIARARLQHYGYPNVQFHLSPSGNELPEGLGEFDFVILSAVYEHLLPGERRMVIPKVWSVIKPGGYLFLNMTPHRYFPIEHHTTGLPLINYLPPRLALAAARKFSNRINPQEPWEVLLRRGIRGATENEILSILRTVSGSRAVLLEPSRGGLRDRIDLWYSALNRQRLKGLKKTLKGIMKGLRLVTGVTLVPNLSLVIRKDL